MKYEPTYESVSKHKIPLWYDDAKFGIFVHWSLFSVPAYAPFDDCTLPELMEEGFDYAMKHNPYAEWYLNTLRITGSPTQTYHEKTYGKDFSYYKFQQAFEEQSGGLDMNDWADFFMQCGAKYVVLVTKHHDGYCLWPSAYKNPFDANYQSARDLVGELTEAVRARGMKMGLYYSGIFDWSFDGFPLDGIGGWIKHNLSTPRYRDYAVNHIYELIERYKPDILWNDIGFPSGVDLNRIFADYYNAVPGGVINDRWKQTELPKLPGVPDGNVDAVVGALVEKMSANMEMALSEASNTGNHCDFRTPEYASIDEIREERFESTRGVGFSFGYNRMETEKQLLSPEDALLTLVDVVSKNGNLLLNVGPMADGAIQELQKAPLLAIGSFLKAYGEAVYGTRPWTRATAETSDGKPVRFTAKDGAVYAIVLDRDAGDSVTIMGLTPDDFAGAKAKPADSVRVSLVGGGELTYTADRGGLTVKLPAAMPAGRLAFALKIE